MKIDAGDVGTVLGALMLGSLAAEDPPPVWWKKTMNKLLWTSLVGLVLIADVVVGVLTFCASEYLLAQVASQYAFIAGFQEFFSPYGSVVFALLCGVGLLLLQIGATVAIWFWVEDMSPAPVSGRDMTNLSSFRCSG